MEENLLGFVMWCAVGGFFLGMAVYGWFAKSRWDSGPTRRCLIGLGIPILVGDPAWIMLSVVGVMAETIAAMVVYCLVIEKKYRK